MMKVLIFNFINIVFIIYSTIDLFLYKKIRKLIPISLICGNSYHLRVEFADGNCEIPRYCNNTSDSIITSFLLYVQLYGARLCKVHTQLARGPLDRQ